MKEKDEILFETLLDIMNKNHADYTNTFIELTFDDVKDRKLYGSDEFQAWYQSWQERVARQEQSQEASKELMKNSNPAIIPRNVRVEEALDAAVSFDDYSKMEKLLEMLSKPYVHSKEQEAFRKHTGFSDCNYKTYCGT